MNLHQKTSPTLQKKNLALIRLGMGALSGLIILSSLLWMAQSQGSEPQRAMDHLVVLYDFQAGRGNTVFDVSGVGTPLHLTIADTTKIRWIAGGGIAIENPTIIESLVPATKITDALQKSEEMSLEAWVMPANSSQGGPARIMTLSQDGYARNFTLAQEQSEVRVRLRTDQTTLNGMPELRSTSGTVSPSSLQHVVYTRKKDGKERLFINGVKVKELERKGDLGNWANDWRFALANELTRDRAWLGEIYLIAVYDKDLNEETVEENYLYGVDHFPHFEAVVSSLPGKTTTGWSTLDTDSFAVEFMGMGVHELTGPYTLNIANPEEVTYILIESISSMGSQSISYSTALGTVIPGSRAINKAGSTGEAYFQVHRSLLAGGPTVSSIQIQSSSSSLIQSIHATVFRTRNTPQNQSIGYYVQDWFYHNQKTYEIEIPVAENSRDLRITIPVTEMSNDNRFAIFRASAGSLSDIDTISTYDPSLGASLRMVTLSLKAVPGTVTTISITAESPRKNGDSFAIGGAMEVSINRPDATFPVEWLDFTARKEGEGVSLNWSTAREMASDFYTIERSVNGAQFVALQNLPAAGNSEVPQHYRFIDGSVREQASAKLLYRLRQVDLDGSFSFSKVVEINLGTDQAIQLAGFPNPVSDFLEIEYNAPSTGPLQLQVLNLAGQVMMQKILAYQAGEEGKLLLPVDSYAPGLYFMHLSGEKESAKFKFVVQ